LVDWRSVVRHRERASFIVLDAGARVCAADRLIDCRTDRSGQNQDSTCSASMGQRECDVVAATLDRAGGIDVERIGAVRVFTAAGDSSESNLERIVEGVAGGDPFERPGGEGVVVQHHWHTRFSDGEAALNTWCSGESGVASLVCRNGALSHCDWADLAASDCAGCCRERTETDGKPARGCGGQCDRWIANRFFGQCGEGDRLGGGVVVAVGQATNAAARQVRPNQRVWNFIKNPPRVAGSRAGIARSKPS
jgi:hypothetical protein